GKKKNQHSHFLSIFCIGPLSRPIINSPNRIPVENIDTVSLTCNATGQVRTYQWFINNRAPTDNRIQLTRDKRTLTVGSLTREHEGSYVCEIKNPFYSNRSDPFTLNVYYGPDNAIILPKVDRYPVGTNITLSCSAKSKPPAKFIWFHKGKKWRPSAKLSLTNVSLKHAGTYICQAFNSHTGLNSTKDKTLTIYVEEKNFTDSEEKNVKINAEFTMYEKEAHTLSGGAIIGLVIGFLAVVVLIGALVYFLFIRTSSGPQYFYQ
uniref:Ig-like domain-containing protein n=1 Tax=Monodelphis domestica TaxID=13616 RepID=F7CW39_MONDO